MDRFQFYPTYAELARRAWAKFRSPYFRRVLEPSAGNGDLAVAMPGYETARSERRYRQEMGKFRNENAPFTNIDCCEIDLSRHDALRAKGLTVVGMDFMKFGSGAMYSHCIMNPPFAYGAQHILKAWDILWDAELVAIVNAETVRNPYTKERRRLVQLVEQYGEVEFIADAFLDPAAERKAAVDVALIYLKKNAEDGAEIVGDLLSGLREDAEEGQGLARGYSDFQQVSLPNSSVENMVLTFNAAVLAMQESLRAQARADYYMNLIGDTLEVRNAKDSDAPNRFDTTINFVQGRMYGEYEELKNRAWAGLLRSANVTDRLSSKAAKRVEGQFEHIKKLEFTLSNIYGFLCGIVNRQGEIQIGMACDVFDEITCYHTDNTVYYKGWKSNDRHRTCGIRIKAKRFVLPNHGVAPHERRLDHASRNLLADFDKVFSMLDGKVAPEFSLVGTFEDHFEELRRGARISSSYFDVRYYPGAGTIHFFPRDAALMDRLNRLVGRERSWLPPEGARVNEAFWLQYEQAEKFDAEVREEVKKIERLSPRARDALHFLSSTDEANQMAAATTVDAAVTTVLERHGIETEFRLETAQQSLLLSA